MDFKAVADRIGYSVYTTDFDKVVDIRDVCTNEVLSEYRANSEEYSQDRARREGEELELAVVEFREVIVNAITNTGIIPSEGVIGLLIDNSGSARHLSPIMARAMTRVCAVLDELGFSTTVAGHTTSSWKGGQARKKWIDDGRPSSSGRLNDFLITVYKDASEPMAKDDLRLYGLNSKYGSFKENIDGEALIWMAERLNDFDAANRNLVFINDGERPVDDSTCMNNPVGFLLNHRDAVIEEIVSSSNISMSQVVLNDYRSRKTDYNTTIPSFRSTILRSSDLVRNIGKAIDCSLRMALHHAEVAETKTAKM